MAYKDGDQYITYYTSRERVKNGVESEIDFGKVARKDSTSQIVLVATQDNYQTTSPTTRRAEFKTTNLSLETASSFSNTNLFDCDSVKLDLNVIGNLNKVVDVYWDDVLVTTQIYHTSDNIAQTIDLSKFINEDTGFPNGITHGAHKLKLELFQLLNEDKGTRGVAASPLSFEIATRKANDTTPII